MKDWSRYRACRYGMTGPNRMWACNCAEMVGKCKPRPLWDEEGKCRSLDANAYCWVLMDKLAAHYGATKEGIYQEEIRQIAGVSDIVCVQEKAADELMRRWSGRGIGWMAEKAPSKLQGCVNVTLWYGSSTYDTEQMARLIDRVVEDCREAGIETMTPQQLAALKSQWGEAQPIG